MSDWESLKVRPGETFEEYRDRVLSFSQGEISDFKSSPEPMSEETIRKKYEEALRSLENLKATALD